MKFAIFKLKLKSASVYIKPLPSIWVAEFLCVQDHKILNFHCEYCCQWQRGNGIIFIMSWHFFKRKVINYIIKNFLSEEVPGKLSLISVLF